MQTHINLERQGDRAALVLSGPAGKPPTLDPASIGELETAIARLQADPPRVVVLKSNSPKFFCVGANLRVLETTNEETIVPWVMLGHRVFNRLEDLPCPVIAQVGGYAMGGGLELAMCCDLIYAAAEAKLAQSEAGLGFIPGWGGSWRLAERVGASQAKRLFFTGAMLEAESAHELGLIDLVVPGVGLDAAVEECAAAILKQSAYAIATFKRIQGDERRAARDRCAAAEAQLSRGCLQDPDTKTRLQQFLARKKS